MLKVKKKAKRKKFF